MTVRRNQPARNPREGVLQNLKKEKKDLCFVIYMFLSNNPSSGDINSSNLSCFPKIRRDVTNLLSATVVIGALRVNLGLLGKFYAKKEC